MEKLKQLEIDFYKKTLNNKWEIEKSHWIPLVDNFKDLDVVFFPLSHFLQNFGIEKLKLFLLNFEGNNEILQWNWEKIKDELYQINVKEIEEFNNMEKFYFDKNCTWVIYISHENTITFGGQKLIKGLIDKWVNWSDYLNKWN
jgi:hypothetical protein